MRDIKGCCPVQMIWQHPEQAVNPRLRMREVIAEGDQVEERIVRQLGIEEEWMGRYPAELSGGELQRFCIARALGKSTQFLLCDEISTMLDLITESDLELSAGGGRKTWDWPDRSESQRRAAGSGLHQTGNAWKRIKNVKNDQVISGNDLVK